MRENDLPRDLYLLLIKYEQRIKKYSAYNLEQNISNSTPHPRHPQDLQDYFFFRQNERIDQNRGRYKIKKTATPAKERGEENSQDDVGKRDDLYTLGKEDKQFRLKWEDGGL